MKLHRWLLPFLFGLSLFPMVGISQSSYAQVSPGAIASVRFEGNHSFDEPQLKRLLRMSLEGYPYSAANLKNDLRSVEKLYQEEGFLHAKVGPPDIQTQTTGEGKGVAIRIPVVEGARYSMGKAEIKNIQALAPAAFLQLCPLKKGQPYNRDQISKWQAKIEETYGSMGYLRARCEARETLREADRTVNCSLECTEGKLYRVGKISIVADPSIDRLQFKRRLLFSEGGIYNPETLDTSIFYINEMRRYKPISKSDVDIVLDDARGAVDITWRLFLPDKKP
jgi:outer membrane protein assembly factor BamA